MTPGKTARQLGIGRSTAYRLVRAGHPLLFQAIGGLQSARRTDMKSQASRLRRELPDNVRLDRQAT